MANIQKHRGKWSIRYRTLAGASRRYTPREGTKSAANRIKAEIERAHDLGEEWVPPAARAQRPRRTLADALLTYMNARRLDASPGYQHQIDIALGGFTAYLDDTYGARTEHEPSAFSKTALLGYMGWLLDERGVSKLTAVDRVRHVERAWAWLGDDDDWSSLVGRPRRLKVKRPPPAIGTAAPTWAEMDAVIETARAAGDWMWKLFFLASRTGLRARSQVLELKWSDVDLQGARLRIRPELGKSRAERRGRVVPLAPVIVAEIAGWGLRQGYLVDIPGSTQREPDMARVPGYWAATGFEALPWGPLHGFRKGFVSGMALAGVQERVACTLTGHQRPGDVHTAIYTSDVALWPLLVEAVAKVPPVTVCQQVVDEITARRMADAGKAPSVQLDLEPGQPIDWRSLPLGKTSDAEISRALGRCGVELTAQTVGYHRKRLGIEAHSDWRGRPKGIDWDAVDWSVYEGWTNVAVARVLGVSPQTVGSRRKAARG